MNGRVHAVLALHLLQHHVQVDVAEAVGDDLLGHRIAVDREGGVLLRQARHRLHDLVVVALGLGGDRPRVSGRGQGDRRQDGGRSPVAEGVAGGGGLELGQHRDLTGADLAGGHHLLAHRTAELGKALLALAVRVVGVRLAPQGAAQDPDCLLYTSRCV